MNLQSRFFSSLLINENVSGELFEMNRDESDDDSLYREVLGSFHLMFFSPEQLSAMN